MTLLAQAKYRRPSPPDSTSALLCWHNPQTLFAESLLVPTTAASEELGEHPADDANVDPNDHTQAVMRQTNDLVANLTDRPISPAQMPSDWWERMLLGASDDAIEPEDARIVFTHILHQLADRETATGAFRQPSARVRIATVGQLHEAVVEMFGREGWIEFTRLYHESIGIRPAAQRSLLPRSRTAGRLCRYCPCLPTPRSLRLVYTGRGQGYPRGSPPFCCMCRAIRLLGDIRRAKANEQSVKL